MLELPDAEVKARLAADPIFRMEREQEQKVQAASGRTFIADLLEDRHQRGADSNGYRLNKELKRRLRSDKRADAALDARCAPRLRTVNPPSSSHAPLCHPMCCRWFACSHAGMPPSQLSVCGAVCVRVICTAALVLHLGALMGFASWRPGCSNGTCQSAVT